METKKINIDMEETIKIMLQHLDAINETNKSHNKAIESILKRLEVLENLTK